MKILFLWYHYNSYLRYFYGRHQGVENLPYHQQHQALLNDFFSWIDYLVPYLQAFGVEVHSLIGNAKPLQQAWARENGFRFDEEYWQPSILHEQIKKYRPDVLWLDGSAHYLGAFLEEIKDVCGYVIAWKAASWPSWLDWSQVDLVLSSHQNFVDRFRRMGKHSDLFLPCFEPDILRHLQPAKRDIEISFVGTLATYGYTRRLEMLSYLQKRVPLLVFAENPLWRRRPVPLRPFIEQARSVPLLLQLQRHPAVYGLDMFQVLHRSKMAFNVHVESASGLAGNIRTFEAAGVGTLLLTDAAPNLSSILEPDKEVITYLTPAEAAEKVKYYANHKEERERIAGAGQKRILTEHTAEARAREFIARLPEWMSASRSNKRMFV